MPDKIKWGILSTGRIAGKMAEALKRLPDAELVAVGSRGKESADSFADRYEIPKCYGSYSELATDPDIDVIYVATPHNLHKENTILCLENGKHVICEKPIAINARETSEMIEKARAKKLFLMEAMWTRFLPIMIKFKEKLQEGVIGEVRWMNVDFGFRGGWDPQHRLLNPNLAGGGLLDVGIYTVSFAYWVMGAPKRVCGFAHIGETNVDEQNASVMEFEGGRLALVSSAVRTNTTQEAVVAGTEGHIRIHKPWWRGDRMTITIGDKSELIEAPYGDNGFEFEAMETMQCIREGKTESSVMPLDESLAIMRTMDEMRGQWGLVYPMER